jgi:hypothetical protein
MNNDALDPRARIVDLQPQETLPVRGQVASYRHTSRSAHLLHSVLGVVDEVVQPCFRSSVRY